MLPRWHILLGALFSILIAVFMPEIPFYSLVLVFLSSFLIDFDHYMCAVFKTKKISLLRAFEYHEKEGFKMMEMHKRGIRKKGDFHIFHTIEFHILVAILGIFFVPFLYIFIGMTFHSLLDVFYLLNEDMLYTREFFLFNWLREKINY